MKSKTKEQQQRLAGAHALQERLAKQTRAQLAAINETAAEQKDLIGRIVQCNIFRVQLQTAIDREAKKQTRVVLHNAAAQICTAVQDAMK